MSGFTFKLPTTIPAPAATEDDSAHKPDAAAEGDDDGHVEHEVCDQTRLVCVLSPKKQRREIVLCSENCARLDWLRDICGLLAASIGSSVSLAAIWI